MIRELNTTTEDALFRTTVVFDANYNATEDIVINQGGQWSSKTWSVEQVLAHIAISGKFTITVAGDSIPNLRRGAYRDFQALYFDSPYLRANINFWNKSDRIFYFKNGSILEFNSYENEQQARGAKRDYLFVNEANSMGWETFMQLASRTKYQVFIDYNPSVPFWAHDKLIGTTPESNELQASVKFIRSWHVHNCFLTEKKHKQIENNPDKDWHRVYARGLTGNLEGIIYTNWQIIPDAQFHEIVKQEDKFFGGLDFGYTNDPTAGVKMVRTAAGLYVHEMFYETGLTAPQIANHLFSNGWGKTTAVCCDSADPAIISEIKRLGIRGAKGALKGPGSILAGINHLKGQKVFVTESSKNILEERRRYIWEKDKDTGKPLNEPIDKYNHGMDAIRYGHYTMYFRQ
jgi:phage terminase large subunit